MEMEAKTRTDLIGQTGSVTLKLTIVDAKEYPTGTEIRVSDNMGEEYWTGFDDSDLD
ncbi:hypothetical protein [Bacillus sp. mrc49]|uniref:hypothetical protein n=1 Tax=Bacillus sp. mrc49 TaxID=2054913 RepID=UPI0018E1F24A|nr:hypothetical protein [Bacillus sp. mrc49]